MRRLLRAITLSCLLLAFGTLAPSLRADGATDAVLTLPKTLPDASSYEGKRVVAVHVQVDGTIWRTAPTVLVPALDEKFVLAAAHGQLARMLESGGFSTGTLDVSAEGEGVSVTYRLTPARFIKRLYVKGTTLGEDDVRRASGLADARDVTQASMQKAAEAVAAYLYRRGFPDAKVNIGTVDTDAPLTVNVEIAIEEGAPRVVSGRTFIGLPTFDEEAKRAASAYEVKVDDRADEEALDSADRALTSDLRAHGFPQAAVTREVRADDRGGHRVGLLIRVVAGSKIVPRFEGSTIFDDRRLLEILGLQSEDDRTPLRLAGKIEDAYVRRGYLDAHVTPELLGNAGDAKRTLSFRIREGRIVTVVKRTYPCLHGALDASRLDEEIDSYLEEDLGSAGFGDVATAVDHDTSTGAGDVRTGSRAAPKAIAPREAFVPGTYDKAVEHLRELFRSEGYVFAEVGAPTLLRATCKKDTQPDVCISELLPAIPDVCRTDIDGLPRESAPIPKSYSCQPEPNGGLRCAPEAIVVIPVNPGPRSVLWDIQVDGAKALAPKYVIGPNGAGPSLRLGEPLALKDIEEARKRIVDLYKDEGYAFITVRAATEYSPDRTRARVHFSIIEGEQVIVERIDVEGNRITPERLIKDRLKIAPGEVYRAKRVRESQDRLARLGVFSSVSIGLANPGVPARRKTVVVSVIEKDQNYLELRGGFSTGEGIRGYVEYGRLNNWGYAVALGIKIQAAYQPFFLFNAPGVTAAFLNPSVVNDWSTQINPNGIDRIARRISASMTFPHPPILGPDWRASLESVEVNELWSGYRLERFTPALLTLTYQPVRWFTWSIAMDAELNNFQVFTDKNLADILKNNPTLQQSLLIPQGQTGVFAARTSVTFEGRDNLLNATKGGHLSLTHEYVKGIATDAKLPPAQQAEQNFFHIYGNADWHIPLFRAVRPWVLAFQLRGGFNLNIGNCWSNPYKTAFNVGGDGTWSFVKVPVCNTYPDRLYYLGGIDSIRGFYPYQMVPQDTVDTISAIRDSNQQAAAAGNASAGGNVFFNPRVEVRIPAFSFGAVVLFLDAANAWADIKNIQPWRLRYAAGPGISIDTPVGPVVLDVGFNLARNTLFSEPPFAIAFSIGRF